MERRYYVSGSTDFGLRGGSIRAWCGDAGRAHITLLGDRFTSDVAVSGHLLIGVDGLTVTGSDARATLPAP